MKLGRTLHWQRSLCIFSYRRIGRAVLHATSYGFDEFVSEHTKVRRHSKHVAGLSPHAPRSRCCAPGLHFHQFIAMFYSPKCGSCAAVKPEFAAASTLAKDVMPFVRAFRHGHGISSVTVLTAVVALLIIAVAIAFLQQPACAALPAMRILPVTCSILSQCGCYPDSVCANICRTNIRCRTHGIGFVHSHCRLLSIVR